MLIVYYLVDSEILQWILVAVWNTMFRMSITLCMRTSIGITLRLKVLPSESLLIQECLIVDSFGFFVYP